MFCVICRVDIRAEEKKLPAVLFLFVIDHAAYRLIVIAAAGVFIAVGRDDEERLFRYILRPGVFMDVHDVMDGSADSVKQRCAAAGEIFLLRHGRNFAERQTVMDDCAFIVEEHGGDERLAGFFLLLCDHGVEAADGVRLQS